MIKTNLTTLIFSGLALLAMGGGLGYLIATNTSQPEALLPTPAPSSSKAALVISTELPFEKARSLRTYYQDDLMASQQRAVIRPKTECIIHNLDSLLNYILKVKKIIGNPAQYGAFTPGISLYLAKSPLYNYLQIKDKDTSYLLEDKYTVFMMPVLYTDTTQTVSFGSVMVNNRPGNAGDYPVSLLKCYRSPFGDVTVRGTCSGSSSKEAEKAISRLMGDLKEFVDTDKDGFDLGHTSP